MLMTILNAAPRCLLRIKPIKLCLESHLKTSSTFFRHKNSKLRSWVTLCYELGRYSKPTGVWLLYIPGTWGISLASTSGSFPDLNLLFLFGVGSILMRGAGCTINDLWDSKLDRCVERTKFRPLATGVMTTDGAFLFLGLQLTGSLMVLLNLNWFRYVSFSVTYVI